MNWNLAIGIFDVVVAARWWTASSNNGAWWTMPLSLVFMALAYWCFNDALAGYKGHRRYDRDR